MVRLEQICATPNAGDYLLRFRRSDGSVVEVTVTNGPGRAVAAEPDLLTLGRWRDVDDVVNRIVPAVHAFATATAVEIDEQ